MFTKPRRNWGRIVRRIVVWTLVLGAVVFCVLTAGRWLEHTALPAHPDVIFVLSDFGERRGAARAAALQKTTHASRVVAFAWGDGKSAKRHALAVLRSHGIPESDIRVVGPARSTDDEAKFAGGLVARCHWTSIAVVTAPFHTRRSGFLFRKAVKGRAEVTPVSDGQPYPASTWFLHADAARQTALEWLRLVVDGRYLLQTPLAKGSHVRC